MARHLHVFVQRNQRQRTVDAPPDLPKLVPLEGGRVRLEYGAGMGSKEFPDKAAGAAALKTWIYSRIQLLQREIDGLNRIQGTL